MKRESIILIIVLLVFAGFVGYSFYENKKQSDFLKDYASVCITQRCNKFVQGDEWISQFCRPEGEDDGLVCKVIYNNEEWKVPLTKLKEQMNITSIRGCANYICDAEILIKISGGV